MTEAEFIERDPEYVDGFWRQPATAEAAAFVLNHPQRSSWYFIRLPSGDLVMAIYPQDDCYFSTEQWRTI